MLVAIALLATGCASTIPEPIRRVPEHNPGVALLRAQLADDPACCRGTAVRWGGVILETRNLADSTEIIILAQPLGVAGEPLSGDRTEGRFIARFPRFLEPSLYPPEQRITVYGRVTGAETRHIGEYAYLYPVVAVETHHLWPRRVYVDEVDDPWLYDYPWGWPWYGYPWYYPPYPYYPHHH